MSMLLDDTKTTLPNKKINLHGLSCLTDLDGHFLAVSLPGLYFLASLRNGAEDGFVVKRVILGDNFCRLLLKTDIVLLNA